jgi:hypothetical protein
MTSTAAVVPEPSQESSARSGAMPDPTTSPARALATLAHPAPVAPAGGEAQVKAWVGEVRREIGGGGVGTAFEFLHRPHDDRTGMSRLAWNSFPNDVLDALCEMPDPPPPWAR